jgi:hypothetical protein
MVREQGNWIFYLLVGMLLAGMALTMLFGPAQSNHSYVSRGGSSRGR